MIGYLITIKNNSVKFTSKQAILDVYLDLVLSIPKVEWGSNYRYELDSLNRLHLHTYLTSIRKIYYPKYQKKGWNIHFQPLEAITDIDNHILPYMTKQSQNVYEDEQLEAISYYKYNYGFINPLSDAQTSLPMDRDKNKITIHFS